MKNVEKYWIYIIAVLFILIFIKPAVFFISFGSIFSFAAVRFVRFQNRIGHNGIKSIGRILTYEFGRYGKYPIIEYLTINGQLISREPYVYISTDLSKIKSYSKMIGKEVQILYDSEDPHKFILAGEKGFNYIVLTLFLLAGLLFIVVGICSLLGYIKMNL
jgi:hypothetical protein